MTDETKENEKELSATKKVVNLLKMIASLKLTVVCLVLLAVLIVWGTVYQADHGLYQAQHKFFYSWVFLAFGFIPFPGTVLVMYVLFFNLVFALIFRIRFRLAKIGNIITHLGIIVLLVGGFFTFYYSEESSLMLKEGETKNMSSSRLLWELAIWENKAGERNIYAVDTRGLAPGDAIRLEDLDLELKVEQYYENCSAFMAGSSGGNQVINASGIRRLEEKPFDTEVTGNTAGGVFAVNPSANTGQTLLLYGEESTPTSVTVNNRVFAFSLRKQKIPLPLNITLVDFRMKLYPNSNIPKSYESTVAIKGEEGLERDVVISMNKPLRYKDLTFFQSSYYIAPDGSEYTILAVVKNFGRLLPYISSTIIFLGLLIHFLVMLLKRKKTQNAQNEK